MDSRSSSSVRGESGAFASPLVPGQQIGEYEIVDKLGEGGFGTVYSALHPLIGKQVAVKVLSPELSANPDMVSRFTTEARAVNTIRHPHIIDIFNFGKLPDGRQYFVMELLDGISFERFLAARGALEPSLCLGIMRDVARALDAAHGKGIVHRDLKPDNIYLVWDDEGKPIPKLLDFGVAKLLGDQGGVGHKTRTGSPVGTPHYMAPEQCLGEPVDERVDVYAFGVVCFEALTGQPPFGGKSFLELMHKQTHAARPAVSTLRPELGTCFDEPIRRLMSIERDARPATLREAFELLLRAAEEGGHEVDAMPIVPESHRRAPLEVAVSGPSSPSETARSGMGRATTDVPVSTVVGEQRSPRGALIMVGAVFALGVAAYVGIGHLTAAPAAPTAEPAVPPETAAHPAAVPTSTVLAAAPSVTAAPAPSQVTSTTAARKIDAPPKVNRDLEDPFR